jgi:four helix bundle protein
MTKEARSSNDRMEKPRKYDLEDRTTRFAEAIIEFAKVIRTNAITEPLIKQLVRSGTSIGANYVEADDASSRKEFRYRIGICKRESRETKYWLRMVAKAAPRDGRTGAVPMDGGQRAASHFRKNLSRQGKGSTRIAFSTPARSQTPVSEDNRSSFVLRASCFFRHSDFVIRTF